ncbi:MAG: hypothetical protein M1485_02850 [Chloroflexi bacterium]|nr:hypothetical protein [Chloroflexota bacterium]
MIRKHSSILIAVAALLLSSMACEPVIAIGYDELLIVFLIVAFLFGPLVLRFWRALGRVKEELKKKKD